MYKLREIERRDLSEINGTMTEKCQKILGEVQGSSIPR